MKNSDKRFEMTEDAIKNYGEKYRGVTFRVTRTATAYMPAKEFYRLGMPEGFHPGYDYGVGGELYDLEREDTGEALLFSLYDWEVNPL